MNPQPQIGAEARLSFSEHSVRKERIAKGYRHPVLDQRLRKLRNRKEAKILRTAPVRVPKVLVVEDFAIEMERINGPRLRDALTIENACAFGAQLGAMLATLHAADIVHGDLTTSNILVENNDSLVLIDFGLAANTRRYEDKAVDLHVLKETLEGTHIDEAALFWDSLRKTYGSAEVLAALDKVELRGRNKQKY